MIVFHIFFRLFLFAFFFSSQFPIFNSQLSANPVSDTWANPLIKKYIAINPGTSDAVWENADQSRFTNGAYAMTAVGDGTYEARLQMVKGASYNYLLFAKTEGSAPSGLATWTTYYDCVPTGGRIQSGTSALVVSGTDTWYNPVYYGVIVNGFNQDARRVLNVPSTIGDTMYIFNNFAEQPATPANFRANAIDTRNVVLTWEAPYGNWGTWGESVKAADVIAGGNYAILRNTTGDTRYYTLLATVQGNVFSYTDNTVVLGNTYYYTILAYDAYQGTATTPFEQLASDTATQDSAAILNPINVFFKVEHFDWRYVKDHDYYVYLTPEGEDPYFGRRLKGTMARVEMRIENGELGIDGEQRELRIGKNEER